MPPRNGPRPPADGYRAWRLGTLVALFLLLWLLTALHLLVGGRREVFQHDGFFVLTCAAPPVLVGWWLVSGQPGFMLLGLAVAAAVGVPFWLVARDPGSKFRYGLAVAGIVLVWLFLDFGLAYEA